METNSQTYKSNLYDQIEEAYGKVVYSYTTQITHAAKIYKRNKALKWAQIILSAISTGGFIGTLITEQMISAWIGAFCSTALLALTAYFKDLDLSAVYKSHLATSNKLWSVREEYMALLVDFETLSTEEIVSRRDALTIKTAEIYDEAPITDSKSYAKAQEQLKNKESQFFTREELDKMLPIGLRKGNKNK